MASPISLTEGGVAATGHGLADVVQNLLLSPC